MMEQSGGELVVRVLEQAGVKKVFCVPGESYLSVLNGLYEHPSIELVSNRHEGGASFMAEAYAKASGKVGVCMATRGPGATNLSIGLHTANQDSTPMVAIIGQVESQFKEKEAFQEVDFAGYFGHLCKWAVEIQDAERIPELLHRAFHIARSGRPGPVVVALPHDIQEEVINESINPKLALIGEVGMHYPNETSVIEALDLIANAKRPVAIVGGGVTLSGAAPLLEKAAKELQFPVVTAFRRYDAFPNNHPSYAGWLGFGTNPDVLNYIAESDLVIALGTRFSQVSTQDYQLLKPGVPLIHVDISPDILGKVYPPTLPIVSDLKTFLTVLAEKINGIKISDRKNLIAKLHDSYLNFSSPKQTYSEKFVDLDGLMYDFGRKVSKDAIIASDAGNFFGWLARYHRFEKPNTYIGPTSGAMGYGFPAAVGAKIAHPDKQVISFSGDGGFMMTMQELATSVRYNVPVIAIVVNNNLYGTIRAHQEKHFPNRFVGTGLTNPNFAELAELFGCRGIRIEKNKDFIPALEEAQNSDRTTLIEVVTNPEILSVNQRK